MLIYDIDKWTCTAGVLASGTQTREVDGQVAGNRGRHLRPTCEYASGTRLTWLDNYFFLAEKCIVCIFVQSK